MRQLTPILGAIMLMMALPLSATNYYLTTSGSDSNSGTSESSAFGSLEYAVSKLSAGDVLYVSSGTYSEDSPIVIQTDGKSSSKITISGDSDSRPVFHFDGDESSSNRGIVMDADYWVWKNVVIENAGDNGMLLSGNNNHIYKCVFKGNHDTGLQLSRYSSSASSIEDWPTDNTIEDCEAYDNCDSDNEDADGFAAKLTCGEGNLFTGCVSHHNIDDGWDLYTKSSTGEIGVVTFKDCIAHNNGTLSDGSASGDGDKNGYKLGSSAHEIDHILIRCVAFDNGHHGFTDNGNTGSIKFTNCTSYNNDEYNYHTRDDASHKFVNCISYKGEDRIVGTASSSCNALIDDDYDFDYTVSSSDFESLSAGDDDDPCSDGFLHLKSSSDLIDAGCSSSYLDSYEGSAPDLGAFEYGASDDDDDDDDDNGGDASVSISASAGDGYVNLSWSTSNIDVRNYQLYRDTDSDPDGRERIYTSTSSTSYTDSDVSNGTTYYYWMKVVDEDGDTYNSDAASATPSGDDDDDDDSSTGTDIIEDDDSRTISYDGSRKSYSNANNGYAINLSNSEGKQIVWNYSASSAGSYTVTLRYTRKSSMNSSAYIYVNDTKVKTLTLDETTSGEFVSSSFSLTLSSGTNEVIFETTDDGESADVDYIAFSTTTTSSKSATTLTKVVDESSSLSLSQNYPNPVESTTSIEFAIPDDSNVKLFVTNLSGQRVATLLDQEMTAGSHIYTFNTESEQLASGIYVYTLVTGEGTVSKRMIIK